MRSFFPPLFLVSRVIFLIGGFILLSSCEGPRDRRKVRVGTPPPANTAGINYGQDGNPTNPNGGINYQSGNGNDTNTQVKVTPLANSTNLPAEFSHCTVTSSYSQNKSLIGEFNICKSNETNSRKILFQAKNSIGDHRLCFFPTNDDSGSGSVMIGSSQCFYANAQRIEIIQFTINRQGFLDKRLSGVMIVKDMPYGEVTPYHNNLSNLPSYPVAYEDCMIYLYNTGDTLACQRFKDKGNYAYISL